MWPVFRYIDTLSPMPCPFGMHDPSFSSLKVSKVLFNSILVRNIVCGICRPNFSLSVGKIRQSSSFQYNCEIEA